MAKNEKSGNIAGGIILILIGTMFALYQFAPELMHRLLGDSFPWPLFVITPGIIFLISGVVTRTGGLLIPGTIVTTIGCILLYQNNSGDWVSWVYIWPLMPGAVGLGLFLSSFFRDAESGARKVGLWMFSISITVFVIAMVLFTSSVMDMFWPLIVIAAGVFILVRSFLQKKPD
ncbi:MAG: hypothetical protein JEZ06_19355 [Anaerolineaceae bacterium]|nr:hypothetical protein [Anaerolineaceae bacterium]